MNSLRKRGARQEGSEASKCQNRGPHPSSHPDCRPHTGHLCFSPSQLRLLKLNGFCSLHLLPASPVGLLSCLFNLPVCPTCHPVSHTWGNCICQLTRSSVHPFKEHCLSICYLKGATPRSASNDSRLNSPCLPGVLENARAETTNCLIFLM